MTKLPWPSWQVEPALDEPPYELADVCAACSSKWGLEDHHIWRRSFGKGYRDAWWVRLEDGRLVSNRVHLCPSCHRKVTENQARILLVDTEGGLVFYWVDLVGDHQFPLAPQPGPHKHAAVGNPGPKQLTVDGGERDHYEVCEETHGTEETCPRCKGAGKVRNRKRRREAQDGAPERRGGSPRTVSIRIPANEETGFEALTTLHEEAEKILVEQGILRETGKGAGYYRDMAVYYAFVSGAGK